MWELGVCYEIIDLIIIDKVEGVSVKNDYDFFLLLVYLCYNVFENGCVSVLVVCSLCCFDFDYIILVLFEKELGDNDFLGNLDL